jgi:hypothetical protein
LCQSNLFFYSSSREGFSFSDFAKETSFGKNQSGFEIKKYADKLKDFVCILIGCTREQLEDQEFKEKELGEEW